MILVMIMTPIFFIVKKIFEVVNLDNLDLPFGMGDTISHLSKAMMFFPIDVWVVVIANIAMWISLQFAWAIIEWIYRKIPGIN
ncbi:MAG: hypothetical protein H9W82_18960 [Lactobacillus sp.]|nr:hypothetical protein [Lactobacillus sp.]